MRSGVSISCNCDIGEIFQDVVDCELQSDPRVAITFADEILEVFVLLQEFVLHGMPDNLRSKQAALAFK